MTSPVRGLWAACLLFALTACGGGGGGGGGLGGGAGSGGSPPPTNAPTYSGTATPADLASTSVVPSLSGWLLLELGLSSGMNSSPYVIAPKSSHSFMQKRIGKARHRAVMFASKTTVHEVTTENCGVSGTTEINDDGLREDGTGLVIFTFRDCDEGDGSTLNGVMRVTIVAANAVEPTDYTLSLENVRVTNGTDSIETGGTVRVVIAGSSVTTTRNTVARYLPDNIHVRLQDFVETQGSYGEATFRGRFYQSQYGYVDVQTPSIISIDPYRGGAIAGRMLLLSGAARVEIRFREQGALSIVVDTNGDGTAERGLSAFASDLFQPSSNYLPMADAGWDRIVDEGERVTLDASGNRDWEGAPLTFTWTMDTVPFDATPVPSGSGSAYEFTPLVPGPYVVQLMVSDGSGSVAIDRVIVAVRDIPGPIANAGTDRTALERSTLTLDATATTHPSVSLTQLQFEWTRISAPANSSVPATLTGMRPQLPIDLPGSYEYRLAVSGRGGISYDTVRITADSVVRSLTGSFTVAANTVAANTTLLLPILVHQSYSGAPLPLAITTDADWLTIDTPNVTTATTSVTVRLDLGALETMANGVYQGVVRIAPTGYTPWSGTFALNVHLPSVQQVSPYVVYTGQNTTANLLGDQLQLAAGRIYVNGVQASVMRPNIFSARVELPPLEAGEYTVSATNGLGIERPGARLIVRDRPEHPDGEVTLPGEPYSLEYDSERDVFYGVFYTDAGTRVARRFHRQVDGTWQFDEIDVPNPWALTLALGGERLLVTSGNCSVYELDPVTLQTLTSAAKSDCYYEDFGLIAAMADGRVLVADTNQGSNVWLYPGFSQPYQVLPTIHSPIGVVSQDRSRMLWAEGPSISAPRGFFVLDVHGGPLGSFPVSAVTMNDSGTYFLRSNLAISGNGTRFMHREDVYDESYRHLGSLQGVSYALLTPALSRRGARAVVYDPRNYQLSLFDLTTGNSFPSLGVIDTFDADTSAQQIRYYPDDTAVFMVGAVRVDAGAIEYRLFVREAL